MTTHGAVAFEAGTGRFLAGALVEDTQLQLAWRFLMFQKNSALAQWFSSPHQNARGNRKLMTLL